MSQDSKLIACRVCGLIMVRLARDVCPKCFQEEEQLFQKVKNFLKANPGATLEEVAKHASCDIEHVEALIRSGRLERAGVKRVAHPCQLCQATIYDGVVCVECKKTLKEQVKMLRDISKPEKK